MAWQGYGREVLERNQKYQSPFELFGFARSGSLPSTSSRRAEQSGQAFHAKLYLLTKMAVFGIL
jgi:hypothetical protein